MRKPIRSIFSPFVLVLPLLAFCAVGIFGWQGEFADGTPLTQGKLDRLLEAHRMWLQTADEKLKGEEKKANVEAENRIAWRKKILASNWEADKGRLVLEGANLSSVNLEQADLRKANLYGANLWKANLQKANLEEANIQATNLKEANLENAYLEGTNLEDTDLIEANLQGIYPLALRIHQLNAKRLYEELLKYTMNTIDKNTTYRSFPWPPPLASATELIPRKLLQEKSKLMQLIDVDYKLTEAIKQNGYYESSYYVVPQGFTLVTRMEQIGSDGAPKQGPQRWALTPQLLTEFSLAAYLRALLFASPGYYRVIVFIVTPVPLTQSSSGPSPAEVIEWLSSGYNRLPDYIGKLKFSRAYTCTALIYEFERASESDEPRFRQPGRIPGHDHLVKAGIWASLQR